MSGNCCEGCWGRWCFFPILNMVSRNYCITHWHKAKPNVIHCFENTLGSRTRETQFFYVCLALLLPVMFKIIVVRSKANSIHKFPQLVGLKISHRYDGLQLIQTLQTSVGSSIAWNLSQTTADCVPFCTHLKEPKRGVYFILVKFEFNT